LIRSSDFGLLSGFGFRPSDFPPAIVQQLAVFLATSPNLPKVPFQLKTEQLMTPQQIARLTGAGIIIFVLVIVGASATYVIEPGDRGVEVTLGRVSPNFKPEGLGFKKPFVTSILHVTVRQQIREMKADCYSSDLQQVNTTLRLLYRVPERSVVKIFQEFEGDPFERLIAPRVHEALKEVAAQHAAASIVTNRLIVKSNALASARHKINLAYPDFLDLVDLVILDIGLSPELVQAIEQKMIQDQEAEKARFIQQRAEIEAETAAIRANGEAEAIRIRGAVLAKTPSLVDLEMIEKWDGKSPLVIGGQENSGIVLPLNDLQRVSR
jgi:prohibitin 2